jgi:hypothetical protein
MTVKRQQNVRPQTVVKYSAMLKALKEACVDSIQPIHISYFIKDFNVSQNTLAGITKLGLLQTDPSALSGYYFRDKRDTLVIARELAVCCMKISRLQRSGKVEAEQIIAGSEQVLQSSDAPAEFEDPLEGKVLHLDYTSVQLLKMILGGVSNRYLSEFAADLHQRLS